MRERFYLLSIARNAGFCVS